MAHYPIGCCHLQYYQDQHRLYCFLAVDMVIDDLEAAVVVVVHHLKMIVLKVALLDLIPSPVHSGPSPVHHDLYLGLCHDPYLVNLDLDL